MIKRFFLYYFLIAAYIKIILFLKGFKVFEDHNPIKLEPSGNYKVTTSEKKTIIFTLYKIPQKNVIYKFGIFRVRQSVNYFLKIEVEDGMPPHLLRHNRMKLQSIDLFIPEKEEDLFLQILVNRYMDYVKKFRD